jgi:hypothetical protein
MMDILTRIVTAIAGNYLCVAAYVEFQSVSSTTAAAPLVVYVIDLVDNSARLSGHYHCGLDRLAWIWIAAPD